MSTKSDYEEFVRERAHAEKLEAIFVCCLGFGLLILMLAAATLAATEAYVRIKHGGDRKIHALEVVK